MSFYRMVDNGHGTGVETEHEKRYLIILIDFAIACLSRAVDVQLDIVPDAETRSPHLTRRQIIANVEREQGRARKNAR